MTEAVSSSYGIRCFKKVDGKESFYQIKFEMNQKWGEVDVVELDSALNEIIEIMKEKMAKLVE